MRKKLLVLSLLAALTSQLQASGYAYMVFTLNDGSTQSITANGLSLSFSEGNLTATSGQETLTFPLDNLAKMAFSNKVSTGVETIEVNQLDDTSDIYDMNGRKVLKNQMRKGVYIVKKNNRTYKITVK